ncbi:hypothetical protein FisN_17Hu020 [Fistulifera solaris]|uniref:Helicase-associated domain-containing protein n=1 Tax=Fistulifera solaris TaxID=1519565 RepID=A0A1Z5JH50_FISSO|nr:hypothetical protein FisN_17Hu020 [Fistulifera solaris]|eukprot:GAX13091.1 hypothetical protein FisN_17Hu020 [Fistulifera solaris]
MDLLDYTSDESSFAAPENNGDVLEVRHETTSRDDKIWMKMYKKLTVFHKANGHCNVPNVDVHESLHTWVTTQQSSQRAGNLRRDREALLNDLSFDWCSPIANTRNITKKESKYDKAWNHMYQRLLVFRKAQGHTMVTANDDNELCEWITKQRYKKRNGKLLSNRKELMDQIGFVWDVRDDWDEYYQRLVTYKLENGHMDVKQSKDKDLYDWMRRQRQVKRQNKMRADREEQLNEIGFVWSTQSAARKKRHATNSLSSSESACKMKTRSSTIAEKERNTNNELISEGKGSFDQTGTPRRGKTNSQRFVDQPSLMDQRQLAEDKSVRLLNPLRARTEVCSPSRKGLFKGVASKGSAETESAVSWAQESETFEGILNFDAGASTVTSVEVKERKVDHSGEGFASLEQLDGIDFCRFWGHCDDGEKDDTPEVNLETFVVDMEGKKRARSENEDMEPSTRSIERSVRREKAIALQKRRIRRWRRSKKKLALDRAAGKATINRTFARATANTEKCDFPPKRPKRIVTPNQMDSGSKNDDSSV